MKTAKKARQRLTAAKLRRWRVSIIRQRGQYLGTVEAANERAKLIEPNELLPVRQAGEGFPALYRWATLFPRIHLPSGQLVTGRHLASQQYCLYEVCQQQENGRRGDCDEAADNGAWGE